MDKEVFDAILETRDIEFNRTLETRRLIYQKHSDVISVIGSLLNVLLQKGVIDKDDVAEIYDVLLSGGKEDA